MTQGNSQEWLHHTARMFHVDFHTPAHLKVAENFDAEAFGDAVAEMGAQAVVLFTKCHYGLSYYNTRVGKRHPGLDFDLFAAQVEACKRRDIRVLAYYSVCRDSLAYDNNPDWRQRNPEGEPIRLVKGDWGTVCMNSPYVHEVIFPQLREFVAEYPVDGLWWDIVEWSPRACYCPYCLEQMAVAGIDPHNPVEHHAFNEWSIRRFLETAGRVGKTVNPNLAYAVNATGGIGRARSSADFVDQILTEYIPYRHGYLYWVPFGHHMRTLGRPFNACMSHWHKAWDDFGGLKTDAQMQYELGHALSVGASCLMIDQPPPDARLWRSSVEQLKRAFDWVKERERWSLPALGISEIAVLADEVTGADTDARHWNSVQGACKMLLEAHYLFDVIDSQADFGNYRLIVLPDNLHISAETAAKLRDFVTNGGSLLATHRATLSKERSRRGPEFALADVLGISYRGLAPYTRGYLQLQDDALKAGLPDQPWIVYDRYLSVSTANDIEVLATIANPIFEVTDNRSYSHAQSPPSSEPAAWPAAITRRQHGEGVAAYVTAPLFRAYWEHSSPQIRTILSNLIGSLLGPKRLVEIEVGPSVDISLMAQGNHLILHLLQYHAERRADLPLKFNREDPIHRSAATEYPRPDQPYDRLPAREIIEDVPPRYNIAVQMRVPSAARRAFLVPGEREVPIQAEAIQAEANGTVRFVIPEVHIHQMVVLELEEDVTGLY